MDLIFWFKGYEPFPKGLSSEPDKGTEVLGLGRKLVHRGYRFNRSRAQEKADSRKEPFGNPG
ncbi:hypothetical protein N7535_002072 [Penicillium sp. DV-2018c]|nr:hypothetical protein N7461_004684 [Penicillium sp. DV-2018c]KAJ5583452.1 hypothetical protein N7535_002072 [Penicillium sp. DV-2018c]